LCASVLDLVVPLACIALGWPIAFAMMPQLAFVLGWYVVMLPPLAVVVASIVGIVVNELVLPRFRGWTVGMLATGLRLPRSRMRLLRLLLRSAVMWLPIIIAVFLIFEPWVEVLWAPALVASAALAWGLVLCVPWRRRPLLDWIAGWHPTRCEHRPAVASQSREPAGTTGIVSPPALEATAPREAPVPFGSGPRLWLALIASVITVGMLVVLAVFVIALIDSPPRPVDQAEAELRNAAAAMERFYDEHDRYGKDALEPWTRWGYEPQHLDVRVEAHVPPDGTAYCLEGRHADIHPPVTSYDSTHGFVRDGSC
jgi:hypothetical protein